MKFLHKSASNAFANGNTARQIIYLNSAEQSSGAPEEGKVTPEQEAAFTKLNDSLSQVVSEMNGKNLGEGDPIYVDPETQNIMLNISWGIDQSIGKLPSNKKDIGYGFSLQELDAAALKNTYGLSQADLVARLSAEAVALAETAALKKGSKPHPRTRRRAAAKNLDDPIVAVPERNLDTPIVTTVERDLDTPIGMEDLTPDSENLLPPAEALAGAPESEDAIRDNIKGLRAALAKGRAGNGDNMKAIQKAVGLTGEDVDGKFGPQTVAAIKAHIESLEQSLPVRADVYSRVEIAGETTTEGLKEALKKDPEGKMLMCQLQQDLKLLGLYKGAIDGNRGINYAFGKGTTEAVTAGLTAHGSVAGIRRAARLAEVAKEAEINKGTDRTNDGIDVVAGVEAKNDAGEAYKSLVDFFEQNKVELPEGVTKGSPEGKAFIIKHAIMMGDNEDASGRKTTFIDGLSKYGGDNMRDVTRNLRSNFESKNGKTELALAMSEGMSMGAQSFTEPLLEIGGRKIDTGLLDSAYIVAGGGLTKDIDGSSQRGTVEVPIWNVDGSLGEHFSTLTFENATYINGSIVMTLENGCEGNLVVIPVQREKYVPQPKPKRTPKAKRPPNQVTTGTYESTPAVTYEGKQCGPGQLLDTTWLTRKLFGEDGNCYTPSTPGGDSVPGGDSASKAEANNNDTTGSENDSNSSNGPS